MSTRLRKLIVARFTIVGISPTRLCLESEANWTLFSFAVVTFRIIESALSLPRRSFVNSRFTVVYHIGLGHLDNSISFRTRRSEGFQCHASRSPYRTVPK